MIYTCTILNVRVEAWDSFTHAQDKRNNLRGKREGV